MLEVRPRRHYDCLAKGMGVNNRSERWMKTSVNVSVRVGVDVDLSFFYHVRLSFPCLLNFPLNQFNLSLLSLIPLK